MFLMGCKSTFNTAPILNFEDQPVEASMTMEKMEKCIITAGADLGWKMIKIKPGMFQATINQRGHTAVVAIPYSAKKYSILYISSSEGLYAGDGKIHKSYNTWVRNLDRRIHGKITIELYN